MPVGMKLVPRCVCTESVSPTTTRRVSGLAARPSSHWKKANHFVLVRGSEFGGLWWRWFCFCFICVWLLRNKLRDTRWTTVFPKISVWTQCCTSQKNNETVATMIMFLTAFGILRAGYIHCTEINPAVSNSTVFYWNYNDQYFALCVHRIPGLPDNLLNQPSPVAHQPHSKGQASRLLSTEGQNAHLTRTQLLSKTSLPPCERQCSHQFVLKPSAEALPNHNQEKSPSSASKTRFKARGSKWTFIELIKLWSFPLCCVGLGAPCGGSQKESCSWWELEWAPLSAARGAQTLWAAIQATCEEMRGESGSIWRADPWETGPLGSRNRGSCSWCRCLRPDSTGWQVSVVEPGMGQGQPLMTGPTASVNHSLCKPFSTCKMLCSWIWGDLVSARQSSPNQLWELWEPLPWHVPNRSWNLPSPVSSSYLSGDTKVTSDAVVLGSWNGNGNSPNFSWGERKKDLKEGRNFFSNCECNQLWGLPIWDVVVSACALFCLKVSFCELVFCESSMIIRTRKKGVVKEPHQRHVRVRYTSCLDRFVSSLMLRCPWSSFDWLGSQMWTQLLPQCYLCVWRNCPRSSPCASCIMT